jgi:hypothetical protein
LWLDDKNGERKGTKEKNVGEKFLAAGKFMSFITPSIGAGCRLADSQTFTSIKFVAIYDDDFHVFLDVFFLSLCYVLCLVDVKIFLNSTSYLNE